MPCSSFLNVPTFSDSATSFTLPSSSYNSPLSSSVPPPYSSINAQIPMASALPAISTLTYDGPLSSQLPSAYNLPTSSAISLPPKLTKKILDLEFIDMLELIPDAWRFAEEEGSKCCHQARRVPKRGPITDITLWIECYSVLVAILTTKYPTFAPEFMAYQRTIVHAQRSFAGDGWSTYDMAYRRNAATHKSLAWSRIDFNLYNETFTGKARALLRCRLCSSEYHKTNECYLAPQYACSSAVSPPQAPQSTSDVCNLFNTRSGNQCRFKPCKYQHVCSRCYGSHPQVACVLGKPPPPKQSRLDNRDTRPLRKY